jgi:hypothetical protein
MQPDNQVIAPTVPVAAPQGPHPSTLMPPIVHDLPAVEAAVPAVIDAVKEIKALKPGYKTTEFWLTLGFTAITTAATIVPADSIVAKIGGLVAAAVTLLGYSVSRGVAKSGS